MPRPGSKPRSISDGKMSDQRESWLIIHMLEAILYVGDSEDMAFRIDVDGATMHRLAFKFRGNRNPTFLNLTALTVPELDALQQYINYAFDAARPSCEILDKEATRRWEEEEDDSFARLYRALPRLIVRKGKVGQHDSSVPSRPSGSGAVDTGDPGDGPGGSSSEVPECEPAGLETSYDES